MILIAEAHHIIAVVLLLLLNLVLLSVKTG